MIMQDNFDLDGVTEAEKVAILKVRSNKFNKRKIIKQRINPLAQNFLNFSIHGTLRQKNFFNRKFVK